MCGYFGVTRSAYYRWLKHPISGNERENGELCALIRQIHTAHPDMGYRRIRDELAAKGIILEDTREGVKWKKA